MDKNLSVRQGAQLDLQIKRGDSAATSVTFYMSLQDGNRNYNVEEAYIEGVAQITLDSTQTSYTGVYDYQINENIPGEDPVKYPDPSGCANGDCGFPTITVCEALDFVS